METKTRVQNFVGGEHVSPTDGRFYDVVNPATGEAYAQAPASGRQDVDLAFASPSASAGRSPPGTPR